MQSPGVTMPLHVLSAHDGRSRAPAFVPAASTGVLIAAARPDVSNLQAWSVSAAFVVAATATTATQNARTNLD